MAMTAGPQDSGEYPMLSRDMVPRLSPLPYHCPAWPAPPPARMSRSQNITTLRLFGQNCLLTAYLVCVSFRIWCSDLPAVLSGCCRSSTEVTSVWLNLGACPT